MSTRRDLTLQLPASNGSDPRVAVVVGEVLWDLFSDALSLGGAPLNFAVHVSRLGLRPFLISAVGSDELGDRAQREIAATGLDAGFVRRSKKWPTGTASVLLDGAGE